MGGIKNDGIKSMKWPSRRFIDAGAKQKAVESKREKMSQGLKPYGRDLRLGSRKPGPQGDSPKTFQIFILWKRL